MRPDPRHEAERWVRQAEHDLHVARLLVDDDAFSDVCFFCQQAAEKALKGLRFLLERQHMRGHELGGSTGQLRAVTAYDASLSRYEEDAHILDQYYAATRYPDALPAGVVPFEAFSSGQADDAIARAERIVGSARRALEQRGSEAH